MWMNVKNDISQNGSVLATGMQIGSIRKVAGRYASKNRLDVSCKKKKCASRHKGTFYLEILEPYSP